MLQRIHHRRVPEVTGPVVDGGVYDVRDSPASCRSLDGFASLMEITMRLPLMFGVMGILSLVTLTQAQTQDKKPPKKLPPFIMEMLKQGPDEFLKQFDKNKDGLLQKDELPPFLQKAFDKVDRNTDGALNREEVTQLLQIAQQFVPGQFPGKGGGVEAIIDGLLKQFDTDTDGKISKAEAKGRIADGFDKLDQNRDGGLDRKELRVIAQSMADAKGGPGGGFGAPPDFDALDKNADGRLTKEELKGTPWLASFADIDANNDSRLDRREFEAYLRKTVEKK